MYLLSSSQIIIATPFHLPDSDQRILLMPRITICSLSIFYIVLCIFPGIDKLRTVHVFIPIPDFVLRSFFQSQVFRWIVTWETLCCRTPLPDLGIRGSLSITFLLHVDAIMILLWVLFKSFMQRLPVALCMLTQLTVCLVHPPSRPVSGHKSAFLLNSSSTRSYLPIPPPI